MGVTRQMRHPSPGVGAARPKKKKGYLCIRLVINSGNDKHDTLLSLWSSQFLDQEGSELASANKEQGERQKGPQIENPVREPCV